MSANKIDKALSELLKKESHEGFKVVISFDSVNKRDTFLNKNKNIEISNKSDFIPSICLNLNRTQIKDYEKNELINRIEEDQQVYLSLLEVNEVMDLNRSKNSQISYSGKNITIGIIDDGVNSNFFSISNKMKRINSSKNLKIKQGSQITHGTIMASIITNQFTENMIYAIGVAPDARIIDLDISNPQKEYHFSDILNIIEIITKKNIKIDILLISFISKRPSDGKDILSLACEKLVDDGIVVVCSAGNFGPNTTTIGSPGAAQKVITIGSIKKDLTIAQYSGRGPTIDERMKPDFCLPGSNIIIPLSEKIKVKATGSSVSAAIGAGLIALIKEHQPELSYNEIFDLLRENSRDLELDKYIQGYGMPNVSAIFDKFNMIHERIIPYNFLIKKSVSYSLGLLIILVVIFFLISFFRI
jgi:serine protease AprX